MFRLMKAIIRLTNTVHSSSYLYRICKPDDGSHEPKHVAPCSPLFLINTVTVTCISLCVIDD